MGEDTNSGRKISVMAQKDFQDASKTGVEDPLQIVETILQTAH